MPWNTAVFCVDVLIYKLLQMWRHNDVIDCNEYIIFTLSESTVPQLYSLQFLFKSTHHTWRYGRKCEWVFFSEHSVLLSQKFRNCCMFASVSFARWRHTYRSPSHQIQIVFAHIFVKSGSIYVEPRLKWSTVYSTHNIRYTSSPAKTHNFSIFQILFCFVCF